jgi:glycosyltransferase involved in cell wall biosynthesis
VHTFHGHVFEGYFGPLASRAVILAERALARISTRIIVLSEEQRRDIVERFRIASARRVRVIGPGVDLTPFGDISIDRSALRRELGLPEARPLLGVVGRLAPVKGVEDAIAAAARIPGAALAIAGDGPERARLEALAGSLGADARFLGFRDDLARVYAGLDALLLPSRSEGTPLALVEAMASGCACVAARVGGVAGVLGEAGVLVPARDVDALVDATRRLLADPGLRASLGAAGKARAARFSEDRLCDETAALYEELLGRRR